MSFLEKFFDDFFAPWFTIDGVTYGFLDLLFLSLPLCIIGGIVVTWLDRRRELKVEFMRFVIFSFYRFLRLNKEKVMFKKKKKKKSAILSPEQARAFYNSLVASAPMHLKFLSDDQRQKLLARLEKIFCTGEPVEVDLDHDMMFAQAFDEVLIEGNEENDSTDL